MGVRRRHSDVGAFTPHLDRYILPIITDVYGSMGGSSEVI